MVRLVWHIVETNQKIVEKGWTCILTDLIYKLYESVVALTLGLDKQPAKHVYEGGTLK